MTQPFTHGRGVHLASGIWTSVSGAAAQSAAVDMVANNLANSDTPAFKKDLPAFKEYLSTVERDHDGQDIPRGPIKDKEFYPLDGKDQAFVTVEGTYTNFKQGHMRVTQSPLDLAIDGSGFLEVSTPAGIRYTRQGSLKMAMDGRLVTSEGFPVLAAGPGGVAAEAGRAPASTVGGLAASADQAKEVAGRYINLRDRGRHLSISEKGEIYAGEDLVAKLSVKDFQDTKKLRKSGGGLYESMDPANAVAPGPLTLIRQGMLEASNVNPVEEMTNLIKANRLFEHDLKAMKTYGDMMGREVNDLGKL